MRKAIALIVFHLLFANFISMNNGARTLGMGNAFFALADRPSSIFYNPAGIARINNYSMVGSHQNLYNISGLYSNMMAISLPSPYFRTGFAIQRLGLENVYYEQIIYVSTAGIIKLKNVPIRFGASLKYKSIEINNYDNVSNPSNIDLDFGLILDLSDNIFLGYSVKNLLNPTYIFISHENQIKNIHGFGISYNWQKSVNFLADYIINDEVRYWNLGSEMWFYDVFAARLGLNDEKLTIGFGIKTKIWLIDAAIVAHEELGSTYRISLGCSFVK